MGVRLLVGAVVLAGSFAGTPAVAQDRLVHQEIDGASQAIVRVFRTTAGGRIELETPQLTIIKSVAGTRVTTTMREAGRAKDALVLVVDEKSIAVKTPTAVVTASRTDRSRLEAARRLLASSSIGRRAAEIIGQLALGPATPVQPMLLTTRAFILAATGEDGTGELSRWAMEAKRRLAARTRIVKAGWYDQDKPASDMTPTECWNAYAKEAIEAFTEYEDCRREHSAWWDVLGRAGCDVIYDMRALGAFSWWLKCTALA